MKPKKNQKLTSGPYKGATVKIVKKGWVTCRWPDGREFKARITWLKLPE